MKSEIKQILLDLKNDKISVDDALLKIKKKPYEDINFAKVDLHRNVRQGIAEVIYGAGKTGKEISDIISTMKQNGQECILITKLNEAKSWEIEENHKIEFYYEAKMGIVGDMPKPDGIGKVLVVTGGTSDIPIAKEAVITAKALGNEVMELYDVGVAGLHRLLSHIDDIMDASVIIAIAGMEGALASVIGGLADCPVIAVPTSVGYGASFNGVSALLSMLNSCASGVSVVNIDNGFGAAYLASMINHMEIKK